MFKVGRKLHLIPDHPLHTIKSRIEQHFASEIYTGADGTEVTEAPFEFFDDLSPIVSVQSCFDDLLVVSVL